MWLSKFINIYWEEDPDNELAYHPDLSQLESYAALCALSVTPFLVPLIESLRFELVTLETCLFPDKLHPPAARPPKLRDFKHLLKH